MYYYIFESVNQKSERASIQEKIKNIVSDLGIAGEINSPSTVYSIEQLVIDATNKGYSTIVAVGGIKHIITVASLLVGSSLVFGVIPYDNAPELCQLLHIQNWREAPEVLKLRRFIPVRLGVIDPGFTVFLTPCQIPLKDLKTKGTLQFNNYRVHFFGQRLLIQPNEDGKTLTFKVEGGKIRNNIFNRLFKNFNSLVKPSIFTEKKGFIKTEPSLPIIVDGSEISQTPAHFSLSDRVLKLIIAKQVKD